MVFTIHWASPEMAELWESAAGGTALLRRVNGSSNPAGSGTNFSPRLAPPQLTHARATRLANERPQGDKTHAVYCSFQSFFSRRELLRERKAFVDKYVEDRHLMGIHLHLSRTPGIHEAEYPTSVCSCTLTELGERLLRKQIRKIKLIVLVSAQCLRILVNHHGKLVGVGPIALKKISSLNSF